MVAAAEWVSKGRGEGGQWKEEGGGERLREPTEGQVEGGGQGETAQALDGPRQCPTPPPDSAHAAASRRGAGSEGYRNRLLLPFIQARWVLLTLIHALPPSPWKPTCYHHSPGVPSSCKREWQWTSARGVCSRWAPPDGAGPLPHWPVGLPPAAVTGRPPPPLAPSCIPTLRKTDGHRQNRPIVHHARSRGPSVRPPAGGHSRAHRAWIALGSPNLPWQRFRISPSGEESSYSTVPVQVFPSSSENSTRGCPKIQTGRTWP